jgi:hypothetical protein
MFKSTIKRRIQALGFLFLMIGTFSTVFNIYQLNITSTNKIENNQIDENENLFDINFENLNFADFSSSYSNTGENIGITLHQSYLNNSFDTILNTSNSNNNKFALPCPTDTSFNSSYTKTTIDNISAPNKSISYEEDSSGSQDIYNNKFAASFSIIDSCYVDNISVYLLNDNDATNSSITIQLYNSSWNSGSSWSEPQNQYGSSLATGVSINNYDNWYTLTDIGVYLDVSNTDNNTFFIVLIDYGDDTNWYFDYDAGGFSVDGSDDIDCFRESGIDNWVIHTVSTQRIDFGLKCDFYPNYNTPKPTDIKLKINEISVKDITNGQGYWESTNVNGSVSGELQYIVSAEWWDVTCKISQVQINYTKTDLIASSFYKIPGSGQSLDWNCTLGVVNNFDVRFSNYEINFTIFSKWVNFTAFNGLNNKTSDINPGPVSNSYRDLQILNADNGTNWYITAQSENLLKKIHTNIGLDDLSIVDFTDTISFLANFSETISDGAINLTVYSPTYYENHSHYDDSITPGSEISLGTWTISDNATEYGVFKVQVRWHNDTAGGFLEKDISVMGVTDLILKSPLNGQDLFLDNIFNITVFYNDTGLNSGDQGIPGQSINVNTTIIGWEDEGNGDYSIEINTSDYSFGWNFIQIEAYDTYYHNASTIFSFHLRQNTTIIPSNTKDFGDVIRGKVKTYEFNYSDISGSPITGATPSIVQLNSGFTPGSSITENIGESGNYTIQLNTSNVQVSAIPYECIFNITALGKETQTITVYITVIISQTDIEVIDFEPYLIKKDGLNQTVLFYFSDTDNNDPINDLSVNDVRVTANQTGQPNNIWLYPNGTEGYYILNISITDLNSGWIELIINATIEPNYATSLEPIIFYYQGNLTQTHIRSINDVGGEGTLIGIGNNYTCFIGRDLTIDFNITDIYNSNSLVTGMANSYLVEYVEIGNPTNQGTIGESLSNATNSYQGIISTSDITTDGSYEISLKVFKTNFETSILRFNLTLRALYIINISLVDPPTQIIAGDSFRVVVQVKYNDGTDWLFLNGTDVRITPIFDGTPGTPTLWDPTNSTGEVDFEILTSSTIRNITLSITVQSRYYHEGGTKNIYNIIVHAPSPGLTFEDLLPYIIIIGIAAVAIASSVGIYKGIIVPKKREKSRVLTEVKTIFDDAINLEHILVLYKGTGTCIYFKSFGSEQIDPELISGFISAISSFGKDLVSQEELNEISYGDKMLLLSDGEYIRVALVLSKKASLILRRNLMEFIHNFEKDYSNELPNWRGQLNLFRDAGTIVDEILSTSIILPHEITYEFSNAKALKKAQSRDVLKIAQNLMKDSERNFFFIATLLKEATEKTGKDTAEIFIGIKELRDKKILMPIEISAIEVKPISQQELNLISQKVSQLVSLSPEEKQKLVNDLAQIGPAEREAYFVSLSERHEIISAPIETKTGAEIIDNKKAAKKEIKTLKKNGLKARKEKDYDKAIKNFQNAFKIATNWELTKESQEFDDFTRLTKIEDLKAKMKTLEKEARLAAKKKDYNEAAQKYKMSSKIASEIFKLGEDMTKEVKKLTNKAKEYEKLV